MLRQHNLLTTCSHKLRPFSWQCGFVHLTPSVIQHIVLAFWIIEWVTQVSDWRWPSYFAQSVQYKDATLCKLCHCPSCNGAGRASCACNRALSAMYWKLLYSPVALPSYWSWSLLAFDTAFVWSFLSSQIMRRWSVPVNNPILVHWLTVIIGSVKCILLFPIQVCFLDLVSSFKTFFC